MKLKFIYTLFCTAFFAFLMMSNSGGRAAQTNSGNTGAPGDEVSGGVLRTCQTCHSTGNIQVTLDIIVMDMSNETVTAYVPGQEYTVTVRMNHTNGPAPSGYGFQMVSLFDNDDTDVAAWSSPSDNTQIATASNTGRQYAEHNGVSLSNEFSVKWRAPESGSGSVTFYACGNGVNDNGSTSGDGAAINELQLTEGNTSNVNKIASNLNVEISPNPVSGQLTLAIDSKENKAYEIRLLNYSGQLMISQSLNVIQGENIELMDMSEYAAGAYFIQIINEEGSIVKKIFKQ